MTETHPHTTASIGSEIRRLERAALLLVGALVAGTIGWGFFTEIDGAVVGAGTLIVDGRSKTVQHLTSGRVAEIRVREGDGVGEGDVLIRLDDTVAKSQFGIIDARLDEFLAREARLGAELAGDEVLRFPDELLRHEHEPSAAAAIRAERAMFEAGRSARSGSRVQLQERIVQTRRQIEGLDAQRSAKQSEIALMEQESAAVETLFDRHLVGMSRTMPLRRGIATAKGELGRIDASTAESRSVVAESELRILQIDKDLRTETARDLTTLRGQIAEYRERRIAAREELRNTEIRAPKSGRVNHLEVHTLGGVIKAGEPLLSIVPLDEPLVAEARIAPTDIDRVRLGASVTVRLEAGNQRTLPTVAGTVVQVADETSTDQRTGAPFYPVRVEFAAPAAQLPADLHLVSGMPLHAFVGTGARSPVAYLFAPLLEQVALAWRER